VIDLDRGWATERLDLEPLAVAHATELAPLLDDPSLHEFTGGAPLPAPRGYHPPAISMTARRAGSVRQLRRLDPGDSAAFRRPHLPHIARIFRLG